MTTLIDSPARSIHRRIPTPEVPVELSDIPIEWRRARLQRMPIKGDAQMQCWWIVASKNRHSRVLNDELPTASRHSTDRDRRWDWKKMAPHPKTIGPITDAVCCSCGYAYSDLARAGAKSREVNKIRPIQCAECHWEHVVIRAMALQDQGIELGISNNFSGDLESDRDSRWKILRQLASQTIEQAESFGGRVHANESKAAR